MHGQQADTASPQQELLNILRVGAAEGLEPKGDAVKLLCLGQQLGVGLPVFVCPQTEDLLQAPIDTGILDFRRLGRGPGPANPRPPLDLRGQRGGQAGGQLILVLPELDDPPGGLFPECLQLCSGLRLFFSLRRGRGDIQVLHQGDDGNALFYRIVIFLFCVADTGICH